MIKALSPYWVYIPFVSPNTGLTCTAFTMQVFVWGGDKGNPPPTPTYEQTIKNPTGSIASTKLNISNLISDFVDFTQQEGTTTELIDGNNQKWVKWQTFYDTTNPADALTPSNISTTILTRGYSYGMDGENVETPSNKVLLNGREFKVNRNGTFVLPIEIAESIVPPASLTITNLTLVSGNTWELSWFGVGNLSVIYYEYKLSSLIEWGISGESVEVSPVNITIPGVAGNYDVRLTAYDNDNAILIYSNVFNITKV